MVIGSLPHVLRGNSFRVILVIALGFWSLVAAITLGNAIIQTGVMVQVPGCPDWYVNGLSNLPYFLFWALLTPILWRWVRRRPNGTILRQVLYLAGLGFATAVLAFIFKVVSKELIIHRGFPDHPFGTHLLHLDGLHVELLVFSGTCMALMAWDYYQKYRERELLAVELEGNLAKARLQTLRMQIHPHFLFNALNTISALAERNPRETRRVVARLSEMIRSSLDMGEDDWITVAEEVAFLERYLDIERSRYGHRLAVEWELNPQAREALLPPFLIQPLVENAIRHGIARVAEKGLIRISIHQANHELEIRVWDNGPGCGGEKGSPTLGIGLSNVTERLSNLFGKEAGLCFGSPAGGGFQVALRLPFLADTEPVKVSAVPVH